jgi:hypothetical protein
MPSLLESFLDQRHEEREPTAPVRKHEAGSMRLPRAAGTRSLLATLALVSSVAAACYTTTIELASGSEQRQLVDDLQLSTLARGGPVSRSEIEDRLGFPSSTFEGGRIVTYALRKVRGHFVVAQIGSASGIDADYRLVLVFRADDTVESWSVVDRNRW